MLVQLHPDFTVTGRIMTDTMLGVRYKVSADAALLLRNIRYEIPVERVARALASQRSVSPDEVRTALYMLLGYLDQYGAVVVRDVSVYARLQRLRTGGVWRTRHPGTCKGFLRSMISAYGWPLLAGTMIFYIIQMVAGQTLLEWWTLLPAMLLMSCVVHEAGHALVASYARVPQVFLAKPGFAAVLYARPAYSKGRWISLCGPLSAAGTCVAVAAVVEQSAWTCLLLMAGIIHLCSLLPWTADGKTIWRKQ